MATVKKLAAKAAPKKTVVKDTTPKISEERLQQMALMINELHHKYKESVKSAKALKASASRLEKKSDQTFDMPVEVRDWIEQAGSRLKSMQSKIDRLELENKELKSYKRWAEHKILGSSPE
jgi:two-component sensor histidine kinase